MCVGEEERDAACLRGNTIASDTVIGIYLLISCPFGSGDALAYVLTCRSRIEPRNAEWHYCYRCWFNGALSDQ